jgi:DNA-binding response OmpR family regulator
MLHVLVVEDNPGEVLLVREAIRRSSLAADVFIAYDGEQALQILTDSSVKADLIFLDLSLPKLNGFQILERYRVREGPPLVVLTCSSYPLDRERAFELGAKDYVVKPLELERFMNVVGLSLQRWIG